MDYVLYGAGYRGKRFFDSIGGKDIHAFIDTDMTKHGRIFCGKPVVSLEEYIKKYDSCFIIITSFCDNNISEILEKNNIYQFCDLAEMPYEIAVQGDIGFENCYEKLKFINEEKVSVYGINSLSFMIYDLLYQEKEMFICPEKGCCLEKVQWLRKHYPQIRIKEYTDVNEEEIILNSIGGQIKEISSDKIIDLFDYASNNILYRNEKLLSIKSAYKKDKRCFIIATGPSLLVKDLHTLSANHVFCFGVNRVIKIKDEWMPDAYVVADTNFAIEYLDEIKDYGCKMKFVADICKEYWNKEIDDSYKTHSTTVGLGIDFSEEIEQKINGGYAKGGTVIYQCLQIAVYMGFSEIYLLGADCNYTKGSKNNYFIAEDTEDNYYHRVDLMIKAYMYAKEYADAHGIKIYNATRGGMLEVFERVDFDSLFKDKGR